MNDKLKRQIKNVTVAAGLALALMVGETVKDNEIRKSLTQPTEVVNVSDPIEVTKEGIVVIRSDVYYKEEDLNTIKELQNRINEIYASKNIDNETTKFTSELLDPNSENSIDKLTASGKYQFILTDYYILLTRCNDPYAIEQNLINYYDAKDLKNVTFEDIAKDTILEDCVNELYNSYKTNTRTRVIKK